MHEKAVDPSIMRFVRQVRGRGEGPMPWYRLAEFDLDIVLTFGVWFLCILSSAHRICLLQENPPAQEGRVSHQLLR